MKLGQLSGSARRGGNGVARPKILDEHIDINKRLFIYLLYYFSRTVPAVWHRKLVLIKPTALYIDSAR